MTENSKNLWLESITPKKHILDIDFKELWDYKYLLMLFVRRDFVSIYKQTILGPLWFFIQPIFTTLIFTVIFGQLASIPTDGLPQVLFYMCGITCWNYFSESLSKTQYDSLISDDRFLSLDETKELMSIYASYKKFVGEPFNM